MKITKISARGFKGRDAFSHDLAPMTVFYGANFRGKTRVMDAIRLALLGHLPELGNTNPATFGLASGTEMEVVADFDNGLRVRRVWTLVGNSVKKVEDVPEGFKALGDLSVMLDAESYFGLGDRARVDYVFAHCPVPSGDKPEVIARLLALAGNQDDPLVKSLHMLAFNDEEKGERPMPAYIEKMIEGAAEQWKSEKAVVIRAEKMIQQLTAMRLGDDPTASIAVVEGKKTELAKALDDLNQRKGQIAGRYDQMITAKARRQAIDRELQAASADQARRTGLCERLVVAKAAVAENPEPPKSFGDYVAVFGETRVTWSAAHDKTQTLEAQLTVLEAEWKGIEQKDACPYCGAKGDGWKALKTAEVLGKKSEAKAAWEKAVAAEDAAYTLMGRAQQERDRARAKWEACTVARNALALLESELASLETRLARVTTLSEERERLMPEDPETTAAIQTIQTEINVKNDELRALEREVKVLAGRQFELKRLADAEKERDEAKAAADYAAVLGKELRVIQGEMVTEAFKPLLSRANAFFSGVMDSPLAYYDGEIGTWRDSQWVGHRTFSGTEKALTYAAIQMALAMQSPLRLMLLDELGRVDEVNLGKLMTAVFGAVRDGLIDGFVGIDVAVKDRDGDYVPRRALGADLVEGLQVIEIQ